MSFIAETLVALNPRSLKLMSYQLQGLVRSHLWAKVLLGFFLGIGFGYLLGHGFLADQQGWVETLSRWVAFPGYLFLRIIQMIVLPLICASVILGVASSENVEQLKVLGLRIASYFISTTVVSLSFGVLVATVIRPGRFMDVGQAAVTGAAAGVDIGQLPKVSLQDQILSLFPQNPFSAFNEAEMLQIVIFSLIIGVALISMRAEAAQPLLRLMESIQEVCMTVVKWGMKLAPFAVFGLTTSMVASVGGGALLGLGVYMATVVLGLSMVLGFYLLMVTVIAKRNPWSFLQSIFSLQLLAFSTSSSAAVMPLSLKTAEDDLKVRSSVAQFVIPLGSTINMDGTAMYQMVATLFLAQAYGVDLSMGQLILVGLTAVGASIGSPGTPGVGIVILASILQSAGIPLEGTGLIIAVDRILDMLRTVVNVSGDVTASVVLDSFEK
jgi:Na+/H+-dicarboxylate symporter